MAPLLYGHWPVPLSNGRLSAVKLAALAAFAMNLEEIKAAVDAGVTVHWAQPNYVVVKGKQQFADEYLIKCLNNDNVIGLTWRDGVTLNGREDEFYLADTTGAEG